MIQTQAHHNHKTTYRARTKRKSAHTCKIQTQPTHAENMPPQLDPLGRGGGARGTERLHLFGRTSQTQGTRASQYTQSHIQAEWGEIESRRRVAKSRTDVCAWADGHRKHIAGLRRQPRRVHPSKLRPRVVQTCAGAGRLIDSECLTRRHATLARAHTTISLPCAKRLVPWSRVRAIGPPPSSPRDRRARK